MIERRIKELSIALEALSRINNYQTSKSHDDIANLLEKLIVKAHDDFDKEAHPPPLPTRKPINLDDEIPF